MVHRVKNFISSVIEINFCDVEMKLTSDNIETWDSLKHMNLVLALEDEFGVEFSDDEIVVLSNYSSILSILKKKISS